MLRVVIGVFFVLHGLVHLLYLGQSQRFFELAPNMTWPDGSWAFAKLPGTGTVRLLASLSLVLATLGFIAGSAAIFLQQSGWRLAIVGSAVFSSLIFLVFWDGEFQRLDNKGAIGILINLAILAVVFLWRPANLDF
ncbi:MAG: hypothetical protein GYA59_09740 [Chloroflexi bacterium]|nr:hypothetical protein [Chloroflexota bacterium]